MGRNILILADGTGNEGGLLPDESRTNVYKLFRAVRVDPNSGIKPSEQLSFYVRGIGTPSPGHTSWMQRRRERIQQIVGMGLTQKITDCLVAIISAWRPGDRIYLFGFSRGAYTVRCLAHVLELLGIPTTEDDGNPISFEPKALHSLARKAVGILYKWGLPAKNVPRRDSEAEIFRYKHSCKVGAEIGATPYFIGVWDTVAAIGWTHLLKIKYDLHYPKDVRFARHAMAIDEYRKDFVRVQWGGSGTIPDPRPGEPFPFEQVWFAGNHADIGGSYPENESRLSDIPSTLDDAGEAKHQRELRAMNNGSNRLPIIEAQIKIEHDAHLSAVRTSIEHAIKAGALLEEAKGLLKHGQWLPWLSDHCGLSDRTAQRYMRLARNAKSATMADLGIAAADRLLGLLAEWDNDEQHDAHVRNWLVDRFINGPWHDADQQEKERGDDTGDDKDAELFASLRDKAEPNVLSDEDTHPLSCGGDVAALAYFAREAAHDARRVIARAKKEERKAAADARGDTGDDTGDKAAAQKPKPEQPKPEQPKPKPVPGLPCTTPRTIGQLRRYITDAIQQGAKGDNQLFVKIGNEDDLRAATVYFFNEEPGKPPVMIIWVTPSSLQTTKTLRELFFEAEPDGLNLLVKELRAVTDLSTIEADDRATAIENLESVITKARACLDALETNDKEHLDAADEQEEIERKRRVGNTN
jgi:uncharacterized protein (DUF2235 family)